MAALYLQFMEDGRILAGQDIACMHKRPASASQKERPTKAGRLIIRHTDAERDAWQRRAADCGLCLSEFMRTAADNAAGITKAPRKKKQISRDNPIAYALLKIGSNINQQTHALNTIALSGEAPDRALCDSITRAHAELSALLAALKDAEQ